MMSTRWKVAAAAVVMLVGWGAVPVSTAVAAPAGPAAAPAYEHACAAPTPGSAACDAIQLLFPSRNWHPGPAGKPGSAGGGTVSLPSSGYYPGDLQSAYALAKAAAAFGPGPNAPTVAIVDAYDDPHAASDLSTYRSTLNGVTDPNTGIADGTIPPLCPATGTTGCVTFKKVNQSGGTSYPRGNSGWGEEISVDVDMISAICPDCNITLVEASSDSFSNLETAVSYAKSLHPAVVTNSYGGSEFSSETSDNSTYSAAAATAVTVATGDSGYGVEFPAAAPDVSAVGGTSLTYTGTGLGLAWNPQTVWSSAGSGCSAYESMPSWQKDSSVYYLSSVCGKRQVGDVAAVADPNTGVAVYDTYGEPGWMVFGGTSVAAQVIGGVYGLAAGGGTIQASPSALYTDASTGLTTPTIGLTPVGSGSTTSCGDYLCNAGDSLSSGYNGPTGLGTPSGAGAFEQQATLGSLSFSPSSGETLTAGGTAGPFTVDSSTTAPSGGTMVTLITSSSTGGFSTSAGGPFSPSLTVPIDAGAAASGNVYYSDTTAGTATMTASASGWSSASMAVTVNAGPLATITVSPSSATVSPGGTQAFAAMGEDLYGNPVSVAPNWTTTVSGGSFSSTTGSSTTFTAGSTAMTGTVTATYGSKVGSASVTVTSLSTMDVTVTAGNTSKKGPNYHVPLTVDATNGSTSAAVSGASVSLQVYPGTTCSGTAAASSSGTTGSNGQFTVTFSTRQAGSWCAVATVTDSGYSTGSGQTPFNT